ncbi:hypothetical protein SAMN06265367_102677 [Algoriphagus winogradskyi]|uniref:Uncharacterized protein n=1 Tax=Algoriphagus winogradskyi TaxID=237017 RepID=A0ABY1NSN6_9BACT|nr:hypothetical protein SAMN06265367_102677 [Algoriphagus winogradskyi]
MLGTVNAFYNFNTWHLDVLLSGDSDTEGRATADLKKI